MLRYVMFLTHRHEDNSALYGGHDGLDVVKEIIRVSPVLLKPEG